MSRMVPPSTPKVALEKVIRLITAKRKDPKWADVLLAKDQVVLVGVRAYYLDTMGAPGKNDRGIYDDALIVVSPGGFMTFNANVDPSVFRKGIATLPLGVYRYKPGLHGISRGNPYPAFVPANPGKITPATRDGQSGVTTAVAINIHRGGVNTTSSAGCQTVVPTQWNLFHGMLTTALNKAGQSSFPYILADQSELV